MQSIISSPGAESTPMTPREPVATPSRLVDHGTRSKEASLNSPFHSEPPSEYQKFNNELMPSNRLKTFSPNRGVGSLDRNWAHRQRHQSLPQSSTPTSPPPQRTPDSPLKSQTGNELTLPDRLNTSSPNRSMGLDRNWTPKQRQQSIPQSSITPPQPTSESQSKFQKDIKSDKLKITSPMRGVGTSDRNWTPTQKHPTQKQQSESQLHHQQTKKSYYLGLGW